MKISTLKRQQRSEGQLPGLEIVERRNIEWGLK